MKWEANHYYRKDLEEFLASKLEKELKFLTTQTKLEEVFRSQGKCNVLQELLTLIRVKDGITPR